jgi:hypothetical protein
MRRPDHILSLQVCHCSLISLPPISPVSFQTQPDAAAGPTTSTDTFASNRNPVTFLQMSTCTQMPMFFSCSSENKVRSEGDVLGSAVCVPMNDASSYRANNDRNFNNSVCLTFLPGDSANGAAEASIRGEKLQVTS